MFLEHHKLVLLGVFAFVTTGVNAAEPTCYEKAKAADKECAHPCCVKAKPDGKDCEKCNPPKK